MSPAAADVSPPTGLLCPESECGHRLSVRPEHIRAHCAAVHASYEPYACPSCTAFRCSTYEQLVDHLLENHEDMDDEDSNIEVVMDQDVDKDWKLSMMVRKCMAYANISRSPAKKRRSPLRTDDEIENRLGRRNTGKTYMRGKDGKITAYFTPIQPSTTDASSDRFVCSTPKRASTGKLPDAFDISHIGDDDDDDDVRIDKLKTKSNKQGERSRIRKRSHHASQPNLGQSVCPVCGQGFRSSYHMQRHHRVLHVWAPHKLQCPKCPFPVYFKHQIPLTKHNTACH